MCSSTSAATTRSNSPSGNGRDLTLLPHRGEDLADAGELVGVHVQRDHVRAPAVHLEGMPAGAAAHVEHPLAGPEAQPVEVNGQHAFFFLSMARS
jgi:hypothetical protein